MHGGLVMREGSVHPVISIVFTAEIKKNNNFRINRLLFSYTKILLVSEIISQKIIYGLFLS